MLQKLFSLLIITSFLFPNKIAAQDWIKKMQDTTTNFNDVKKSFNKYWAKQERKEKLKSFFTLHKQTEEENEGMILYKRWENFVAPRVFPSGERRVMQAGNEEIQKLITSHQYRASRQIGGNWTPVGSFVIPDSGGGAGRLQCVRFDPSNYNNLYVGACAGGLWKSNTLGNTWTTNTDALPSLGINDVIVDPTNSNIIYIATGDGDHSDTYSVGVLKSIDGGNTWNITGLSSTTIQGRLVYKLLMDPYNHNTLYAGASNGIFKSIDAGVTWIRINSAGTIRDIEFRPGSNTCIYAISGTTFLKSLNAGNTWATITNGLPPATSINRMSIAVSPAAPSFVYVMSSNATTSGFYGLYFSNNSATSFVQQSNTPELLGWDVNGGGNSGQGWYTLPIAVNPIHPYEVVVGGVNVWRSIDGGVHWSIIGHWTGASGVPYVHADIHDITYRPDGSAIYVGTDGGIFVTYDDGVTWADKSAGLMIGQLYRIGNSNTHFDKVIQGWQDNGTNLYDAGGWDHVVGGDGMECFIDWNTSRYQYAEYQYGAIYRSSNYGDNFQYIKNQINEAGEWVTPWCEDPLVSTTIYAGYKNVWKSTDQGNNWTAISTFNSAGLTSLAVAPSNPLYIYASNNTLVYRTADGGTTWNQAGITGNTNAITYLTVCTTNPLILWATVSGYTAMQKVFKSVDGGVTWTNITHNLPNIPANCVINQTGTADGVYVGTDVGVYYIDNTMTSWMPFSNGLPNVVVDELEIHYPSNLLRAGTFGRGLWETPIRDPFSNLPFANFRGDTLSGCPGFNVQFYDSTLNAPTAWQWHFPGGVPDTSSLQNPVVTYSNAGTYNNVTLVVTNANGTDSVTKYSYVAVSPNITPLIYANPNDTICSNATCQLVASPAQTYLWSPANQTSVNITVNNTGTFSVKTTDVFNCATQSDTIHIYSIPAPAIPTITASHDTLFSSSPTGNQWVMNGSILPGETNSYYVVLNGGNLFRVIVTDAITGCSAQSSIFVEVDEINTNGILFDIYPNPATLVVNLSLQQADKDELMVNITDVLGKVIYTKKYPSFSGKMETTIDITTFPKGIYLLSIKNAKGITGKKLVVY